MQHPEVDPAHPAAHEIYEHLEHLDVRLDNFFYAGILDLDGCFPSVFQDGPVHLAEGCRGNGLFVELGKDVLGRRAKLVDYPLPDLTKIMGRDLVLQFREFFDIFVREEVLSRTQKLADLDHHAFHLQGLFPYERGISPVEFSKVGRFPSREEEHPEERGKFV